MKHVLHFGQVELEVVGKVALEYRQLALDVVERSEIALKRSQPSFHHRQVFVVKVARHAQRRKQLQPHTLLFVERFENIALDRLEAAGLPGFVASAGARALLDGRRFVLPDDLKPLARPVMAHRIILTAEAEAEGITRDEIAPATFIDLRRRLTRVSGVSAGNPFSVSLRTPGATERLDAWQVSEDFLPMLGVQPVIGRAFRPEDFGEGAAPVVLLNHGAWQQRFGGDSAIVGSTLPLDGARVMSRALTGLGAIAVVVRQEIVLFIMGGVFVVETLSVIVQVASFKLTGKRVFRMAPIHHHYELKGWKENQVVVRFWIITMLLVLFGLSTLKLR